MPESTVDGGRSNMSEWEPHKETIRKLYIDDDKTLEGPDGVIETMKSRYNFYMTKSQYERRFRLWGFRKNQTRHKWVKISHAVIRRDQSGKASDVYIDDVIVPEKKLRKEVQRYGPTIINESTLSSSPMDSSVVILTPHSSPKPLQLVFKLSNGSFPDLRLFHMPSFAPGVAKIFEQCRFTSPNLDANSLAASVQSLLREDSNIGLRPLQKTLSKYLPGRVDDLSTAIHRADRGAGINVVFLTMLVFSMANWLCEDDSTAGQWFLHTVKSNRNGAVLRKLLHSDYAAAESLAERLFRHAMDTEDIVLLRALLDAGVDPNEQRLLNDDGYPANVFQEACSRGNLEIVKLLLEHGAEYPECSTDQFSRTWVHHIALNIDLIRLLQDRGHDVTSSPSDGYYSLLMYAAEYQDIAILEYLLENGATVNYRTEHGWTALYLACSSPARVPRYDNTKYATGKYAREFNLIDQTRSVTLLLAAGANPNTMLVKHVTGRDPYFEDPLENALTSDNPDILRLFLEHGCRLQSPPWKLLFERYTDPEFVSRALTLLHAHHEAPLEGLLVPQNAMPYTSENYIGTGFTIGDAIVSQPNAEARYTLDDTLQYLDSHWRKICIESLLETAMKKEDMACVKYCLRNGAIMNILAVHHSKYQGCVDFLVLLNGSAREDREEVLNLLLPQCIRNLDMALVNACRASCFDLIKMLLGCGAQAGTPGALCALLRDAKKEMIPFNETDPIQMEPYYLSAVLYFLQNGADPNDKGALYHAIMFNSLSVVELLLSKGARVNDPRASIAPIAAAAEYASVEIVQLLLSSGADHNDMTALTSAVSRNNSGMLKQLLQAGCDPNRSLCPRMTRGYERFEDMEASPSPLSFAIREESEAAIRILLENGADPNAPARGNAGKTALQAAVVQGNRELVEQLHLRGVDVNAAPSPIRGATALQYAAIQGFIGIAEFLIDNGADVNALGAEEGGRTAIEGAAEHGRIDMINFLVQRGARLIGEGEKQYETARVLARNEGRSAARRLLEKLHQQQLREAKAWTPFQESTPVAPPYGNEVDTAGYNRTTISPRHDTVDSLEMLDLIPFDVSEIDWSLTEASGTGLVEELTDGHELMSMFALSERIFFNEDDIWPSFS